MNENQVDKVLFGDLLRNEIKLKLNQNQGIRSKHFAEIFYPNGNCTQNWKLTIFLAHYNSHFRLTPPGSPHLFRRGMVYQMRHSEGELTRPIRRQLSHILFDIPGLRRIYSVQNPRIGPFSPSHKPIVQHQNSRIFSVDDNAPG